MPLYQVDAFTSERFRGNPAAICILESKDDLTDAEMQQIAAEMNLSETAFIIPMSGDHCDNFQLRWFTPKVEVSLCGHATLASAHVLFKELKVCREDIHFQTQSGELVVNHLGDRYQMDFPLGNPTPSEVSDLLCKNLGIQQNQIISTFKNEFKGELVAVFEVISAEIVKNLNPNWTALVNSKYNLDFGGVYVTARSDNEDVDFVSRCFFPWVGIREDPVTGSAHTVLGPFWQSKLGKNKLFAYQVSDRLGEIWMEIPTDNPNNRIFIQGKAITVLKGTLII
ncbi:MAG: PhzF family phenazine biosynthesis protein [Candidatus Lokiarchaeota archaeon]|nr:PhzF family phenazine biosynthesis protein [Candidatus Lokiarchaeota archaeon]